jgi:hypothetical protein
MLFCLSWLLIVSGLFLISRGTKTELADARRSRSSHDHPDARGNASERRLKLASVGGLVNVMIVDGFPVCQCERVHQ